MTLRVPLYRNTRNKTFQATTWQIKYDLENVNQTGSYTLRVALASASAAELQVYILTFKPQV